jgi:hypothetical protein
MKQKITLELTYNEIVALVHMLAHLAKRGSAQVPFIENVLQQIDGQVRKNDQG